MNDTMESIRALLQNVTKFDKTLNIKFHNQGSVMTAWSRISD